MTENLLLKLEEKTMILLSEVEELRKQVQVLSQENAAMKSDKDSHTKKLQDLIGLLDAVGNSDSANLSFNTQAARPVLVQA